MDLNLTAVFRKVPQDYIGFVEELPGANTQGATLEEARANLQEAVTLVLEANRELVEESTKGGEVSRAKDFHRTSPLRNQRRSREEDLQRPWDSAAVSSLKAAVVTVLVLYLLPGFLS